MIKGIELEKSLLGLLLEENKLWEKVRGYLSIEDFIDKKNKIIFQAMIDVSKKGFEIIDISILIDCLEKKDKLKEIGGVEYIDELILVSGFATNLEAIIKEINLNSRKRKVETVLSKVLEKFRNNNNDIEKNIEEIEKEILTATRDETISDFVSIKEVAKNAQNEVNQKIAGLVSTGLQTDFLELDKKIGGLQPGNLVILAARPGMGKTTFAINIATNIAKNKKNVAFFSLEMSSIEIINRIVSSSSLIPAEKIKDPTKLTNKQRIVLNNKYEEIGDINFFIDDSATIRLSDLIWKAKKLNKNNKLDLLIVDYLQLLGASRNKNDSRHNEVSIISRSLKQLARELEIPIIALSQLSRKVEQRIEKKPILSDLRESGSIEQDADIILFINKEIIDEEEIKNNYGQFICDIIIAKHRSGSTGNVKLTFKPDILTFFSGGIK